MVRFKVAMILGITSCGIFCMLTFLNVKQLITNTNLSGFKLDDFGRGKVIDELMLNVVEVAATAGIIYVSKKKIKQTNEQGQEIK